MKNKLTENSINLLGTSNNIEEPFQLELFDKAKNYQQWVFDAIAPFLGERILEVGAGTGNMSRWLPVRDLLILSEAHKQLIPLLQQTISDHFDNDKRVEFLSIDLTGNWKEQMAAYDVDTIISFNVLEHIEDDKQTFKDLLWVLQKSKSSSKKRLITFVPAHQFAFGSLDTAYGHYRRYSKSSLALIKKELAPSAKFYSQYFNVIGLFGWVFMEKY